MKVLFKSFTTAFILTIIFSMIPFSARSESISNEVFRLHILANSDSKSDQALKLKVRDRVLDYTENLYKSSNSVNDAETLTAKNLQAIANVAKTEIERLGYSYSVKAEIKKMYFNTRKYNEITMPSGVYNALRITIGEGKGHNWWCVMYPSLCVGTATNYNSLKENTSSDEYNLMTKEKYEYKFFILECFEKICDIFS